MEVPLSSGLSRSVEPSDRPPAQFFDDEEFEKVEADLHEIEVEE
jgi:hypothetical protein